jgi:hypothetical protein
MSRSISIAWLLVLSIGVSANAYVTPMIGGGQTGMTGAPMKHADISFDGTDIMVHVDDTVATPVLRPLVAPQAFDPAQPYSVLTGKAYNYQWAWNAGGFITLPTGGGIWIERLHQDTDLEVYLRPPMFTVGPTWPEIFTTDGERWKWSGAMQHNAYAVLDPLQTVYTVDYRVYLGDATTGVPLPGYGSADVTWTWNASPVPEPSAIVLVGTALATIAVYLRRRWPKHTA